MRPDAGAIGIFDSGVGGLSVLRHIRTALPAEDLFYVADAGFAPYGDKPEAAIVARSLAIAACMAGGGVKAIVVACNTATAAAITAIRQQYPALGVVGVEPGLKPSADLTVSRTVGVLATAGTLSSSRFARLQSQIAAASGVRFLLQPCPGLADRIERGELETAGTARLIGQLVTPLLDQGADVLVLGCTHYPFVAPLIQSVVHGHHAGTTGRPVALIDTGSAVARQLESVLRAQGQLRDHAGPGGMRAATTGSSSDLTLGFERLLSLPVQAVQMQFEADCLLPAALSSDCSRL